MALPAFQLIPTTTSAAADFALAHGFKQGDVPAGSSVVAPVSNFQCYPINRWPDGSLKVAVLSGTASVVTGTPLSVQLSVGAAATGTLIAGSAITATAVFDCGVFGSTTFSGTDWASPWSTEMSGPKMSQFRYRKPVGTDAHLVAWLEVRVWASGAVEVLPWIENGYWRVASPTNKNAVHSFTLGGTQRFSGSVDLKHHQRTVLLDGVKLSHWLGADPGVTPFHDQAYFKATELVPTYVGVRSATGLTNLPTTFTPLQKGGFIYDGDYGPDAMTNPGYQPCIGLLPEHDVAYLTCTDQPALLYSAVIRNGFSVGRYGIHYRDETTQRPPAFATYPTLVFQDNQGFANTGDSTTGTKTPVATGGNAPIWDTAHHPSVGYLAYLISGWSYFREETQFAAVANHFYITDWVRGGGTDGAPLATYTGASALCLGGQTRATAWALRTLAQALVITPDSGDPFRASLIGAIEENARFFHQIYVAQPNNPFGVIQGGDETNYGSSFENGRSAYPPWQMDFLTASVGMALCFGLPLSSTAATKLAAFYQWTAKSSFVTLGTSVTWNYINGAPYTVSVSPVLVADYRGGTGPWLTVAQSYAYKTAEYVDTYGMQPWGTTDGVLALGFPESAAQGFKPSMWHNMQPAIAYAVRHGVPGAQAAYTRMTSASNWPQIQAVFNVTPGWSVVPSGQTQTGGTMPGTPGPHAAFTNQPPRGAGRGVFGKRHTKGAPISDIPTGGTNGVSALRAIIENTDDPAIELRIHYTSKPTGFTADGLGGYSYSGSLPATVAYDIYRGGEPAPIGSATDTIASSSGSTVSGVVVSPATATGSANFSAVVNGTGSPSQAVTWSRSGTAGAINASTGAFTAPTATGGVQTITITATSTQDSSKSGTATVTIAAAVGSTVTGVTVSPASIGVVVGGSQQFAATVAGTLSPSQAVTWTVSGAASISTSGLATGPVGVYTVTATSQQNNTKAGTALFAVLAPGSASLAPDIGLNTLIVQGPVGIAPFIG